MSDLAFLECLTRIYRAAGESDDGSRCMVAPSPELRERINSAMRTMAASGAVPAALRLRAAEPRALGFNDGVIIPPEEFPLGTAPSTIRAAAVARPTGPLRGVLRVIVVLVEFPDKPMMQTRKHYEDLFFSLGALPTKSVREYYWEVTHGLIDIQGDVVGPFQLPQTINTYAHGASGTTSAQPNAQTMARDAVMASNPTVDFTPYDNDGNGFVDAFIVIHAGAGGEVTGNSDDIWSHKWILNGGAFAVDQTKIFAYLTVPEDCKIGVCAHEIGHLMFGFPDLYDTDSTSEGIGNWCLMAGGSWGGGGDTPVHPSAWCKANQGWVAIENRKTDATVNIPDVKTSNTVLRLWKNGASGNEYFLLENRQQTGFDVSLPGHGLLIWHIDDSQSTNTDEKHYKVALMQADGTRDMERNANRGDGGDPFPGTGNNRTFNATSNPNSNSYVNAVTGVAVTGIGVSGATMTAQIEVNGTARRAQPARKRKTKAKKGGRAKTVMKTKTARKRTGRAKAVKKRSAGR